MLTHSALASTLAGVSKHYAHALIGNVGDGNFRPSFYKKQYLSMDRLVVVKFHTNIANRWLFMYIILLSADDSVFHSSPLHLFLMARTEIATSLLSRTIYL